MGHVYHDVTVSASKSKKVRMFVDTGASYSILPPSLAKEVGLSGLKRRLKVTLANSFVVTMRVGTAFFKVLGREAPATVLVGKVDEPILGAETLESLGLAVDPSSGKLKTTRTWTVRVGPVVHH